MRPARFGVLTLATTFALGLAACGDDDGPSPTDPGDPGDLTQAEVQAMTEALVQVGGVGLGFFGFAGLASSSPAPGSGGPAAVSIEETRPCPLGGNVQVVGQFDGDPDGETLSWSFTETHEACSASGGGMTWTFDGNPNLATSMSATVSEESFSVQGSQTGGISWEFDDGSGSCSVDVSFNAEGSTSGLSHSVTVSGTVCGVDVSQSFQIGA